MIIEGFESCSHGELPAGWTALDADGDGHSWFAWDYSKEPYDYYDNPQSFNGKSVDSERYLGGIGALTPDNWLISPQVPLKGKLNLWVKGVDPAYAAEPFAIYLSTTGKDVADFTTVLIPETVAQGVLTEYTADLSAYAGQVGYIAIRHFNVTDMYRLGVDNITFTDDWVEADGVTSPYTLDGLDDLSIYEVEVQAVTGEQQSSWSTLRFNTSGFPPTNATILYQQNFDDTNDINELGWTFVDNDGDGRNWTMSINGKYDDREVSPSSACTSVPNSLYSQSFTDDEEVAINADNWAITPAIKIYESTILSFQLAYADFNYPDKVSVYVGETANVNEMTEVLPLTSFSRTANLQFNEETVDLSAFAGKTCYIAFRHQDYDKWIVFIDDVIVYTTAPKYDLTLADGTEDAANWQGKAGEGEYQALPLEGVFAGTAVSVKYNGTKKVIGVKAEKKAAAPSVPDGAINGKFSVSDSKQVYFSKGNLRYASGAWSFFDKQYDYYNSYSADAWDHFGWSTSTTYGMNTTDNDNDYSGDFVDWGATMGTGWFTLSKDEWTYLFDTRSASTVGGTEKGRYAKAKVNDVQGIILFPDTYTHPDDVTAPTGVNATGDTGWNGNSYTVEDWTKMESAGCVFLPAAGFREGSSVDDVGTCGWYWSSTDGDEDDAYYVDFSSDRLDAGYNGYRYEGMSVRLVRQVTE